MKGQMYFLSSPLILKILTVDRTTRLMRNARHYTSEGLFQTTGECLWGKIRPHTVNRSTCAKQQSNRSTSFFGNVFVFFQTDYEMGQA